MMSLFRRKCNAELTGFLAGVTFRCQLAPHDQSKPHESTGKRARAVWEETPDGGNYVIDVETW